MKLKKNYMAFCFRLTERPSSHTFFRPAAATSKRLVELNSSYKLFHSPTFSVVNEQHCCDDVLEAKCLEKQEPFKETEVNFMLFYCEVEFLLKLWLIYIYIYTAILEQLKVT